MKQYEDDFNSVQLSFVPSKQIQDFLSVSYTMGSVKLYTMGSVKLDKSKSGITIPEIPFPVYSTLQSHASPANKCHATTGTRESKSEITIPEIVYPVSSTHQSYASPANTIFAAAGKRESARQSVALTQLKGCKLGRYKVKLSDDKKKYWITGMAITNDGRRLLVDENNKKVKLFSQDMELFSSLSLSDYNPYDIAHTGKCIRRFGGIYAYCRYFIDQKR